MNPIFIVARSELLRRITTKSFVVTTLLAPLALVAVLALVVLASVEALESDSRTIAVVDETGFVLDRLLEVEDEDLILVPADSATVRAEVLSGRYNAYLVIPRGVLTEEESVRYYSVSGGGFNVSSVLRNRIQRAVRDHRMEEANVSPEVLSILHTFVDIRAVMLDTEGEEAGSAAIFSGLGLIMAMLMYFALIFYSNAIFYGVMEEKRSRVVEVLISSVRPFNLLMGKVMGIGAMGLIQLSCWGLLLIAMTTLGGTVIGLFLDPVSMGFDAGATTDEMLAASGITMPSVDISIVIWFVLYFVGGFMLYAGLFAAVGSMTDQPQDAQSLLLPVMLPLFIPMIFISAVLESPNSTLAVVLSQIPFTSPVPMVMRLAATDLAFWELPVSLLLLIAGIIGVVWVSSRIYRIGILMHGKKASIKDAVRWLRQA